MWVPIFKNELKPIKNFITKRAKCFYWLKVFFIDLVKGILDCFYLELNGI